MMALRVEVAGGSHVGRVRSRNEDTLYLGKSLVAVADGLGGHVAGDVASATAVEALRHYDRQVAPETLGAALGQAIAATNRALRLRTEAEPELSGMGTTLVALLRSGTSAALANIGDSRAYLAQHQGAGSSKVSLITEDHLYGHLVADADAVPGLPERLTRFLDGRPDGRSPDITTLTLNPGDRLLLCSDGLSSYVPHHLISITLTSVESPQESVEHLIALALDHGGPDNVTVAVIDVRHND